MSHTFTHIATDIDLTEFNFNFSKQTEFEISSLRMLKIIIKMIIEHVVFIIIRRTVEFEFRKFENILNIFSATNFRPRVF